MFDQLFVFIYDLLKKDIFNYLIQAAIFVLFLLLFLITNGRAAILFPIGSEEYDFLYETFERKEIQTLNNFNYQLAPYLSTNDQFDYSPLSFLNNDHHSMMNVFLFGKERFSYVEGSTSAAFESVLGGVTLSPFKNIFVYSDFFFDNEKAQDTNYTGKKTRNIAGGMEQSFVMFHSKIIDITFGRFKSFWGFKKSLVLSSSNALDGFGYSIHWRKFVYSYRMMKLSQIKNSLNNTPIENRYFAGHRLDFHINNRLRISLFETVIFGGFGRTIEFNYLNPILLIHPEQVDSINDDNSFFGFDFTYYPTQGFKLYCQLLVDDFQIGSESQGNQEPNEYGFISGIYFSGDNCTYDFRFDYVRVTNRTYNQINERNKYIHQSTAIAYFDNNDFDMIQLNVSKWLNSFSKLQLNYSYVRQGEGKINKEWDQPWMNVKGDYDEPFPTGIVEYKHQLSSQLKGYYFKHFYVDFEAGLMYIENMNNVKLERMSLSFCRLIISTYFSTII